MVAGEAGQGRPVDRACGNADPAQLIVKLRRVAAVPVRGIAAS
ncbi:hypothetical protein [Micromonospora echinofusca]|nr:hypothetical protein [Micromonospora echinofusca]